MARSWVGRSAVLRHTKPNRSPLNCLPARAAPTTPRLRPSYFQPLPSTPCTPSRSIERHHPLISAAHVTDVWRPGERSYRASRTGGMCRIRTVFSAARSHDELMQDRPFETWRAANGSTYLPRERGSWRRRSFLPICQCPRNSPDPVTTTWVPTARAASRRSTSPERAWVDPSSR